MEKLFKLKENGTTVKREIIAGITTFLAMAYILAVNPSYLGNIEGATPAAIFSATAISAAIATLCMAFFANYPVALASGMGLNAFFAFTVCGAMGYSYQVALTAVFIEGIIFMILSLFKFREALVNKIPENLKFGITAGIGLFITIIAMINAGIVVNNDATLVGLGNLASPQVVLAIVGLIIIGVLHHFKVTGDILIGIIATWVLGIISELCGWYVVNPEAGIYSLIPSFTSASFAAPVFCNFDFGFIGKHFLEFAVVTFTFLYTDIFDTVGTLIGVAEKADLLDKDGRLPKAGGALMADAVGTVVGACLGTSTVTSYVESSAGVSAGGRTGLTSVVTAILFLLSLVLSPIFLAIPSFATAPAMIFVGLLMLTSIKNVSFDGDVADTIGAFLAIVVMPFTYSIATGIMFGLISWVVLKILTGKAKDISAVMWISVALFVLYIITLVA
ncbi:NCS2 family permease [Qingrenia yutianensis]|uniref:NCS2 family permease n=1 Tax=Qingrenia yutianensis TaxID=2763676 RepID=A0A926F9U1_9FIRM|nr:NCS2 family permease [Qingrenia yutianensis]MBC8595457.1 NCS2 family permease [Qingrenia yutianensis]